MDSNGLHVRLERIRLGLLLGLELGYEIAGVFLRALDGFELAYESIGVELSLFDALCEGREGGLEILSITIGAVGNALLNLGYLVCVIGLILLEIQKFDLDVLTLADDLRELAHDLLDRGPCGLDLCPLGKILGYLLRPHELEVDLLEPQQRGCL